MRGTITQRGKNSWRIQLYTGKGIDGNYHRHVETIRGRKGDAQRRLTELLASLDKGVYTPPGKLTLAEHLRNWLTGYVKTNCSQRTFDGYESIIETHLIPALGHIQLKHLTSQAIGAYYGEALEKLSARTVHHQHRVLSEALKYGVEQGLLGRNPCDLAHPPRPEKKTAPHLEPQELETLLDIASDSRFYPVIYTAVSTGLRQAELLALRWRDIHLDLQSISVSRSLHKRRGRIEFLAPKTERSKRQVAMTPKLVSFLKEYKGERESLSLHLGCLLRLDDLVFADVEGKPIDASVLTHSFARIVKRAGLQNVRFHDLRHTFASLMLLQGAKPKVISEALGHSSVAFTMDVYSHIMKGMQQEAMVLLDGVLPEGKNQGSPKN